MPLTIAQQAKFDELKALIAKMEKTTLVDSYSLKNVYGSYFRPEFEKMNKTIKQVEEA